MRVLKQVIVMRKDLNMRKGKMVAQGAHASVKIVRDEFALMYNSMNNKTVDRFTRYGNFCEWLDGLQTKVCVSVDSEEELLAIYAKAELAGLPCSLVTDAGLTEFKGIATFTAVAVGPADVDEIDKITGNLKLL